MLAIDLYLQRKMLKLCKDKNDRDIYDLKFVNLLYYIFSKNIVIYM